MKTILLFCLCLSLFIFYGCDGKDGLTGPIGPTGSSGDPGIPGGTTDYYIEVDTTWDTDKHLNHSVFIDRGVTLTINPGVTIYMYPYNNIYNYGKIIANGNIGNWIKIKFQLNALFNCELRFYSESTNIFSFCEFESLNKVRGQKNSYLDINNCIIRNGETVGVTSDDSPSIVKIRNSDIISNSLGISVCDISYLSNNYIAYNNGSLIVALSTAPSDPDTPSQYVGLSQSRISPRAIPNFP